MGGGIGVYSGETALEHEVREGLAARRVTAAPSPGPARRLSTKLARAESRSRAAEPRRSAGRKAPA